MIVILFTSGNACHKQVLMPAILGQANEVPLPVVGWPLPVLAITAEAPTAAMVGYI